MRAIRARWTPTTRARADPKIAPVSPAGFRAEIAHAVGMAKRNKMMKFVVPAAIAVGKGAIGRWPIFVAALGGALVHRMWSSRRLRRITASTVAPWADDVAMQGTGTRPSGTTRTGSSSTPTTDAWSPTAPTGL